MSMRKILRRIAKAEMKRAGMERINRRISANTWRRVINAWPTDVETGKPMRHDHVGRSGNYEHERHDHGTGRKLFVYENKFGPTPPRKRFNKQTGQWYYGPRKTLGKVVSVDEAG